MADKKWDRALIAFVVVAALAILLCSVFAGVVIWWTVPLEGWAALGDSFGILNTLFAGLAFAGVIYAILLQRKELELQRHELALTRREIERSAEAQDQSQRALHDQVETLRETLKLNIEATKPRVIVFPEMGDDFILLTIRNIGKDMASDVRFEFDAGMPQMVGVDGPEKPIKIDPHHPLNTGIASLAPDQSICVLWGALVREPKYPDQVYQVISHFCDAQGRPCDSVTTLVDVRPFYRGGAAAARVNGVTRLLREISGNIRDLSRTFD